MTTPSEPSTTGTRSSPFPTTDDHDVDAVPATAPEPEHPTEEALDHGIEESFPASDPVSVSVAPKLPASSAGSSEATPAVAPTAPGDDAPVGAPGTGEGLCRTCGGTGRTDGGQPCPNCQGTGKVNVGIGGG